MLTPNFLNQLNGLSRWQQLAFCCALSQRMLPNYQLFAESTEFAPPLALRKYLDLFWEYLSSPKAKINFEVQQLQFDELVPEANDFDLYGVYPAIDCCVSISVLFSLVLSPEGSEAEQASQISMGTVLGFTELQLGEEDEALLAEQPLVQEELAFQAELLRLLLDFERNSHRVKAIRSFARNQDVSNLGICLTD